jgi:integrase
VQQWRSTIRDHAKPLLGLNVRAIDTATVFGVLEPLWKTAQPTAMRVRAYVETVLDWAIAHGYREDGPNPAAWEGRLEHMGLSGEREKEKRVWLPPAGMPSLMSDLRSQPVSGAMLALQMVMLAATRANETLGAEWSEFDLTAKVWSIPADRMKMKVGQRVPLTDAMVDVMKAAASLNGCKAEEDCAGLVFRSPQGMRMPDARLRETLHKLGRMDYPRDDNGVPTSATLAPVTVHGMRSTFSQWAKEQGIRHELYETALAHAVGSGMERLYGSTDLLDMRRPIMEAWASYLSGVTATDKVVELRSA